MTQHRAIGQTCNAHGIFASEDGGIAGWAPNLESPVSTHAVRVIDNSKTTGAIYKGLALSAGDARAQGVQRPFDALRVRAVRLEAVAHGRLLVAGIANRGRQLSAFSNSMTAMRCRSWAGGHLRVLLTVRFRRSKLELAIAGTESALAQNVDEIVDKMQQLKRHGVRFSLDDVGTGYSSLSYLKHRRWTS